MIRFIVKIVKANDRCKFLQKPQAWQYSVILLWEIRKSLEFRLRSCFVIAERTVGTPKFTSSLIVKPGY